MTNTSTSDSTASFAELEELSYPPAESVLETLQDYAESGAGVSSRVVLGVICKAHLARDELVLARQYALAGRDRQTFLHQDKAAEEYERLSARISFFLEDFD